MKRKIAAAMAVLTVLLMFSIPSFAEEDYTITLDEAIEMAMKDNPQFTSADTKILDAEKQLADAKKTQKNQKGAIRLPEGLSLVAIKRGYLVKQAENNLTSAKFEKEQAQCRLSYDVTQKYYSVKLAEALLESANNAYKLTADNKKVVDSQYALGLAAEIDVNNAAYSVSQTKTAVDKYARDYDIARRSLLIALQIEDESVVPVLTDTIDYTSFSSDVDSDIKKAMETRFDVKSLDMALSQAELYRDITLVLGYKAPEYSAANQAVVQCEYTSDNTKKLIALSLRSSYNNILNADDAIALKEENLTLRNQEYNIKKLQYELGMITNTQLTAALNAVTTAQIELDSEKLNHKLAVIKYGYETTIGL